MNVFVVACSVLGASVTLLGCGGGGGGSTTAAPAAATTAATTTTPMAIPTHGESCTLRIDHYGDSFSPVASTTFHGPPGFHSGKFVVPMCTYLAQDWGSKMYHFGVATCNGNITTAHFFSSKSEDGWCNGPSTKKMGGSCVGYDCVAGTRGPDVEFGPGDWMAMTCVGCPKIVDVETSATLV